MEIHVIVSSLVKKFGGEGRATYYGPLNYKGSYNTARPTKDWWDWFDGATPMIHRSDGSKAAVCVRSKAEWLPAKSFARIRVVVEGGYYEVVVYKPSVEEVEGFLNSHGYYYQ